MTSGGERKVNDSAIGCMEDAHFVLVRTGVVDEDSCTFIMQLHETRAHFDKTTADPSYALDDDILTVLDLLVEYDDKLSPERSPFQVEPDYSSLMWATASCNVPGAPLSLVCCR